MARPIDLNKCNLVMKALANGKSKKEALIAGGYSKQTVSNLVDKMMLNPQVKAMFDKYQKEALDRVSVDCDQLLENLARIAFKGKFESSRIAASKILLDVLGYVPKDDPSIINNDNRITFNIEVVKEREPLQKETKIIDVKDATIKILKKEGM